MSKALLIAVDGPAASGKGTVASALARHFDIPYLDTGLLYRAVGVQAQREGGLEEIIAQSAAQAMDPALLEDPATRTREAGEWASRVAAYPGVRAALLDFQRQFAAQERGAVLDGRDIGTVIAPDAPAKLFVTASPQVRATRRWKQLTGQGEQVSIEDVMADIARRDARDSGRADAPLIQAADAHLLDTSEMTIEHAFREARRLVEQALGR
jgi:cytidylate kinase